ncbi:hypothetical protein TVAG_298360 [Trichomonas vaginalis G3]|uniref:Rab-GAP TBC domain-containing protein n=1 Tax=Trichomonas vaginalis (strain ATCC PRA-98 / G3) TaxID=412133 RepID=A2ET27_TRIV3|nr:TBC domain-containing protein kinase-like protein family [Trichomonas vaginalis G3]EAY04216.1 hypothetical protein TVAG_298360 [Trichomonas vaginalis G3]KAI5493090.1 TBC domain-containing protein kinase-like protein family [Trichomonas vaginalis G3]|eukprot:XP_001316439.1 hypothetical protein [Trichomonas vaginalis G3]
MEINHDAFIQHIKDVNTTTYGTIIHDEDTLNYFLEEFDTNKNLELRFLAYCLKFKCVSFENYAEELYQKIINYEDFSRSLLGDSYNEPLKVLSQDISKVIAADEPRGYNFFIEICHTFGVQLLDEEYGHLSTKRIHSVIGLIYPELSYTQGYDRYTLMCFGLALKIVQSLGIDNHYAEGLCFDLVVKFIQIANINEILENPHGQEMFTEIDNSIQSISPKLYDNLKEYSISSLYFAISWRLLFFTHVHPILNVLIIWDRFLLHSIPSRNINNYFVSLALAHIKQVVATLDENNLGNSVVENIQSFTDYDLSAIITDAEQFFHQKIEQDEEEHSPSATDALLSIAGFAFDVLKATTKLATRTVLKISVMTIQHALNIGSPEEHNHIPHTISPQNIESPNDFVREVLFYLNDLYD